MGAVVPKERTNLTLRGVYKTFGTHVAIDDASFEVEASSVTALIGPSGAGKSTLLRCVNLLEMPDRGEILVNGMTLQAQRGITPRELAALRRSVGMVFQSFNLFPHLSVLRNITLPQERVLHRSAEEARDRAYALLDRVGLKAKASQYPSRLSGGQQQRIAIARALALDPEVMLFDEPTSSLDPELGLEVLNVMRELAEAGMTMIVVTHEMQFAESVSDQIIVMADGKIIETGDPAQVMRSPKHERTIRFLRAVKER